MRETCARVLAAALMTGAIATVVGMSALFQMPAGTGRPIAAPPSSLQRSVRLQAQATVRHRPQVRPLETAHSISRPARPVVATRSLVVVRRRHARPPARQLTSVRPKRQPVPAPAPVPAAAQPPAGPVADAAPLSEPDKHAKEHGEGRGHGHDSDKQHKEHDKHED